MLIYICGYLPMGRLLDHMSSILCVIDIPIYILVSKGSVCAHTRESPSSVFPTSFILLSEVGTGFICFCGDWWYSACFHVCSCSCLFLFCVSLDRCPGLLSVLSPVTFVIDFFGVVGGSSLHILCFNSSSDVWLVNDFLPVYHWLLCCLLCYVQAYQFAIILFDCLAVFLVLWWSHCTLSHP